MSPSQTYLKFASTLNHVAYCFVASAYASVQGFSVQSSGGHLRSDSGKCCSSDFSSPLSMRMHSLNRLSFLNSEPLNTEHSKRLLIAIPNRNCSTHLVKQSGCKELIIPTKIINSLCHHLDIF